MKKNLRNRLLALAAVSVSSIMLLSGFDSSMTVEDIMSKAQEANASLKQFSAHALANGDIQLDATVSGQTQSMPMTGNMDMDMQYTLDPIEYSATATMSGDASAMGMAGEAAMEMYMVNTDDGGLTMYVKVSGLGEGEEWQAVKVPEESAQMMNDLMAKSMAGDYSAIEESLGIDIKALQDEYMSKAVLAPEAVNVNGKDCYEITMTLTGEDISSLLTTLSEAKPEIMDPSAVQMIQMFTGSLQFNIVEDIDVETFRPVYVSCDLAGSDFSMISQLIGSMMFSSTSSGDETETPEINLTVNDLSMKIDYDYESPVSIEVPEEALAAEVSEVDPEALAEATLDTAA